MNQHQPKDNEDLQPSGIIMIMGYPAAGKTTRAKKYEKRGFIRLNRDEIGGTLDDLVLNAKKFYTQGFRNFVFDNTYPSVKSRKTVIDWAKKATLPIHCEWIGAPKNEDNNNVMNTSITDIELAFFNAARRMVQKYGKLLSHYEMNLADDPNIFPVAALYSYKSLFEPPTAEEGFTSIRKLEFKLQLDEDLYENKAIILDYDGTLRVTKSGKKYPLDTEDIKILPGRSEILKQWQENGYILLGVSNQSAIGKGEISEGTAVECFQMTNYLLGLNIDYSYCPHSAFPINCYCRKPMPGLGVELIEDYKLDPKQCIMVGDLNSDKTFAKRCGFKFVHSTQFFSGYFDPKALAKNKMGVEIETNPNTVNKEEEIA